jgi:hypothetical protein
VQFTPAATDAVDGPLVPAAISCSPAAGSIFPLGTTPVTCSATDSRGNVGTGGLTVTVVDTTPPRVTPPPAIQVVAQTGSAVPASDAAIAKFLAGATATDIVDPSPTLSNDAPPSFPMGATTVTFTAKDSSGNRATTTSTVTILAAGSVAAPPVNVDRTPPDDVSALGATEGNRLVTLSWKSPTAADFDHVEITRSTTDAGAAQAQIYKGAATSFTDRGLDNGTTYRYVVTSVDHAGNRSAGVAKTAKPFAPLLVSPQDGARVSKPPVLRWLAATGASYYNVQLFRGTTKILSAWPRTNQFSLKKRWKFGGHAYTLALGLYHWYVWPGIGPRSKADYGPLLGTSSFMVGK